MSDSGDPLRGSGLSNFADDLDAVAVILGTTIKLLAGEWFEDIRIGTPLFQELLDHPNTLQGVALTLRQRILTVPFVSGIVAISVDYSAGDRALQFNATVITQFGVLTIGSGSPV